MKPQLITLEGEDYPGINGDPFTIVAGIIGAIVTVCVTVIGIATQQKDKRDAAVLQAVATGQSVRLMNTQSVNAALNAALQKSTLEKEAATTEIQNKKTTNLALMAGGVAIGAMLLKSKKKASRK